MGTNKKLKANSLGLQELPRLEDLFVNGFEAARDNGVPEEDVPALKLLRSDLESMHREANKRAKVLALELTKLFDVVENPPEIESVSDEVLLTAWRDKTLAELKEIEEIEGQCRDQHKAAAVAVAPPPPPMSVPSASKRWASGGGGGGGGAVESVKRRSMRPWPSGVPFVWRDSMKIRVTFCGH